LTSSGTASVTISAEALTGSGFTASGLSLPVTLAPGHAASLSVQFDPQAAGAVTGALTITSNSSTNPSAVIALSGTGTSVLPAITAPTPSSALSGSTATFAWTAGSGVTQYQLWLGTTGVGSGNLGVYGPSASTPTSVAVTGLPTNGVTVNARLAWVVNGAWAAADYTYTAAGSSTAALSALTCTSSSLTGAGTDICTVTLSAAAATGGESVSLSSSSASVTVPSTVSVAAGATSATFAATVSPVSSAQAVTLTASAGSVSKAFALELTPSAATLTLNATSVAFGNVGLNTASTQSVILTSTGGSPVTVSAVALTGTGFTVSGVTFPITLTTGQTATLNVQFEPTAVGAETGTLTITSNSSSATPVVALSGTGANTAVNLSWNAPSSSADPVAGYNIYRTPSGSTTYELVNSSVNAATTYADSSAQAGATYIYMVESVDASGIESAPSNSINVTVP